MECVRYCTLCGHTERDCVCSRRCHIHGIAEPLPGCRPAEVKAPARVGGRFQIDAIQAITVPSSIDGIHRVTDTLATSVVIFSLHSARNGSRSSTERSFGAATIWGDIHPEVVDLYSGAADPYLCAKFDGGQIPRGLNLSQGQRFFEEGDQIEAECRAAGWSVGAGITVDEVDDLASRTGTIAVARIGPRVHIQI